MFLYSYLSTHGICGLAAGGAWEQFAVHLKITMVWTQRFTARPWSSNFGDALGGRNQASMEMHFVIKWQSRCTWRPWSYELGGCNRVNLELNLEAVIDRVWRCAWRPWSCMCVDALGCCNRASLEIHLEAVIDRFWRPQSTKFDRVLGGSRSTACLGLRVYSSVS